MDPAPGQPWQPQQFWSCSRCGRHFWTTYAAAPGAPKPAPPAPPPAAKPAAAAPPPAPADQADPSQTPSGAA
ncbi:MAG: hypothetical protein FJW23_06645 [Acidimicrobiia bacterium]|nr:hypothetical protein [Acidimicrobiia bacterium]